MSSFTQEWGQPLRRMFPQRLVPGWESEGIWNIVFERAIKVWKNYRSCSNNHASFPLGSILCSNTHVYIHINIFHFVPGDSVKKLKKQIVQMYTESHQANPLPIRLREASWPMLKTLGLASERKLAELGDKTTHLNSPWSCHHSIFRQIRAGAKPILFMGGSRGTYIMSDSLQISKDIY